MIRIKLIAHILLVGAVLVPSAGAFASPAAAPGNDDIANAVVINSGALPYTVTGLDISGATTDLGSDPSFPVECGGPNQLGKSVWYKITPGSSEWLGIDTFGSGYDTVLGVAVGSESDPTLIACNDDSAEKQSGLGLYVTQGTTYYIEVAKFAFFPGEAETLTLHVKVLSHVIYLPLVVRN